MFMHTLANREQPSLPTQSHASIGPEPILDGVEGLEMLRRAEGLDGGEMSTWCSCICSGTDRQANALLHEPGLPGQAMSQSLVLWLKESQYISSEVKPLEDVSTTPSPCREQDQWPPVSTSLALLASAIFSEPVRELYLRADCVATIR